MKKLFNYFLKGLVIFVPVALTILIVIHVFTKLDSFFGKFLRIKIPGLGLLVTIGIIILIGFLASTWIARRLFGLVDDLFTRLPLIKLLYTSIKQFVEAFAGEKKKFDQPVIVTPVIGGDIRFLGFVTRKSLDSFGLTDYVAVYLPQAYNWGGNVMLLPKQNVQPLNVDSSQLLAFVASGGITGQ